MGPFGALFAQLWAKMDFPGKKGCQFLDIPIAYHRAKNQKKLLSHFGEKRRTDDRRTNGQTDRRFYRTLRRTGVQKKIKSV